MSISLFSNDFMNFHFQPMRFLGHSFGSRIDPFCPVDIDDNTDNTSLKMDLPGVSADNIKVDINDNLLTVSAVRNNEQRDNGYFERSYGTFSRSFRLGDMSDTSNVSASLNQGVLTIIVPKIESESYSIPVVNNSAESNEPVDLSVERSNEHNLRRSPRNRGGK